MQTASDTDTELGGGDMDFLVVIALLPAIVLVVYIYKKDRVEREPVRLLLKLFGFGALSCLPASLAEGAISAVLAQLGVQNPYVAVFLNAFVVAGLCEEVCKFLFLRTTWRSRAFNFQFDAIVYAVTVALGFAALENVLYVLQYGLQTGLLRAVTAVPGHAIFGVFMGYFYGYAKLSDYWGRPGNTRACLRLSVIVPLALHGLYDFLAMSMSVNGRFMPAFFAYLIVLYVIGVRRVNRSAREDRRVTPETVSDYFQRMNW